MVFGGKKLIVQIVVRFLVALLLACVSFYLFYLGYSYGAIFGLLLLTAVIYDLYAVIKASFSFYDRTIEAIIQNDFSASFKDEKSAAQYSGLIRLYSSLKEKQYDELSKDIVFRSILDTIDTGVLILKQETDDWSVFLMNDFFSDHFTVPKVSKWKYLKKQLPAICSMLEERAFSDLKTSLKIRVGDTDTQTFMMQTSRTRVFDQLYYVVMLDSIQKVIEKKERDAWLNLMKVISHELMNSLTPVRSLAQNMKEMVQKDRLSKDELSDIRASVDMIMNRSDHLQKFVDNYRELAMLPSPKKDKVELSELIQSCISVMQKQFTDEGIEIENTIDFKRWLFIDRIQMEQVLINLLLNSKHAMQKEGDKKITIDAEHKNKRVYIRISDTGKGIDKEIEDKIFLPFFTTRNDGAGIGLTLSKSVVEAHGGYLTFQEKDGRTTFVICLVER